MSKFHRGHIRSARLTPSQVYEIRLRYTEGETQRSLGDAFGVATVTIGRIVRGESWRQFDNPAEHSTGPVSFPKSPGDIQASMDRLASLLGEAPPPSQADSELDRFISPETRRKYLGEAEPKQETHPCDTSSSHVSTIPTSGGTVSPSPSPQAGDTTDADASSSSESSPLPNT